MHKLTEIEIGQKRKQYSRERDDEWNKIVRSAAAAGNLLSGNTIIHFIKTGFRYIDIILNSAYSVETGALLKNKILQPDTYFMDFKDKLFQITEEESGIVRSKALAQYRSMGESIQREIVAQAGRETADLRESILSHVERIKEQVKLDLSQETIIKKDPLVFISYDTRDIELPHALAAIIKRIFTDRIRTFIAKRDIKAGDDAFKTMLHDSLAKSAIVLAICTKRSLTSPWLWFEAGAGFGSGTLIPVWAGINPQEFKPPMTIFQGKSVTDKTEMEELITRIAEVTKVPCTDCSLTAGELDSLKQLVEKFTTSGQAEANNHLEKTVEFQLAAPNDEKPIQYLIEATFPVSQKVPLQRFMALMDKSKIHIKGSESQYSHDYPIFDPKRIKTIGNDIVILNASERRVVSNEARQELLVKSGAMTITYWVRHFHWESNGGGTKLVYAREINEECIKLLHFFWKLSLQLKQTTMNIRIRLFDLQNASLLTDNIYFKRDLKSYKAPINNEIEIQREIGVSNTSNQEFVELLMHVWENFRSPDNGYPSLKEEDFVWFFKNKIDFAT